VKSADVEFSGIDFDDNDFGFKEEDKSPLKVLLFQLLFVHFFTNLSSNIMKLF
jgi:hypothetical protein